MSQIERQDGKDELSGIWSIFFKSIYFFLFALIIAFSYLLLQDQINDYLNPKTYTEKELAAFAKKSDQRRSDRIQDENWDKVSNGIHLRTGLHDDPNLEIIITSCTSCHSAKLITQNKATRTGWESMITWMQETQGLQDLGKSEPIVLDYLAKYYAPKETGRRKNLDIDAIEWHVLSLD